MVLIGWVIGGFGEIVASDKKISKLFSFISIY